MRRPIPEKEKSTEVKELQKKAAELLNDESIPVADADAQLTAINAKLKKLGVNGGLVITRSQQKEVFGG